MNASVNVAIGKLVAVWRELDSIAIERGRELKAILLAVLTRQHCFLFGVPGLAKSMVLRMVAERILGARYFEALIGKETTADELFVSETRFEETEQGPGKKSVRFINETEGKSAGAHFVLWDEIFKGAGTLLNTGLAFLNERLFHVNGKAQKCPLVSLFAASNELPDPEDGLAALYDRILFRVQSQPIAERQHRIDFTVAQVEKRKRVAMGGEAMPVTATISLDELATLQRAVAMVEFPYSIHEKLFELFVKLGEEGQTMFDRRYGRLPLVLQANALLDGRDTVTVLDFVALEYVLWDDPKDQATVRKVLLEFANPLENEALRCADAVADAVKNALAATDGPAKSRAGTEASSKLKSALAELNRLKTEATAQALPTVRIEELTTKLKTHQKQVLKQCFGIDA